MSGIRRAGILLGLLLGIGLGGCAGGGEDGDRGGQTGAPSAPAQGAPARPLPARWYEDADRNGVPNFVEQQLGNDPATDDCLAKAGCDGALVEEALRLVEKPNNTMLLLDSSGSMAAPAGGGQSKIAVAKEAITAHVKALPKAFRLGFEVFGHRGSGRESSKAASCRGVEILAQPGELEQDSVDEVLDRFEPRGFTPLAAALRRAGSAFEGQEEANNKVILVTDGVETCGRDPVAAARALRESGVAVTVDVVGFDVGSADAAQLRKIAEASGGTYTDARSDRALQEYFEEQQQRLEQLNAAVKCVARSRDTQFQCATDERDATLKAMSEARDQATTAGRPAEADAIGAIIDRALALREDTIEKRLEGSESKIDQFLREFGPTAFEGAAYRPDDACRDLQRALAHGPPPGTRLA